MVAGNLPVRPGPIGVRASRAGSSPLSVGAGGGVSSLSSESVSDSNSWPASRNSSRSSSWFSIIPLCTIASFPVQSVCGWAFAWEAYDGLENYLNDLQIILDSLKIYNQFCKKNNLFIDMYLAMEVRVSLLMITIHIINNKFFK